MSRMSRMISDRVIKINNLNNKIKLMIKEKWKGRKLSG